MLETCLLPLILMGYALPVSTPLHPAGVTGSPIVEVRTCNTGLGAFGKITKDVSMAGLQYGFSKDVQHVTYTVTPQLGLSFSDNIKSLPCDEQYMLGLELGIAYKGFLSKVSYSHMSDGRALGLCPDNNKTCSKPNLGIDLIAITTGFEFDIKKLWR